MKWSENYHSSSPPLFCWWFQYRVLSVCLSVCLWAHKHPSKAQIGWICCQTNLGTMHARTGKSDPPRNSCVCLDLWYTVNIRRIFSPLICLERKTEKAWLITPLILFDSTSWSRLSLDPNYFCLILFSPFYCRSLLSLCEIVVFLTGRHFREGETRH